MNHTEDVGPGPLANTALSYPDALEAWEYQVRPQLIALFMDEVYGRAPEGPVQLTWRLLDESQPNPDQVRRQIGLTISGPLGEQTVTVLVHMPANARRVAAFIGLNFWGNHTTSPDPDILMAGHERPDETGVIHFDHLAGRLEVPPSRGLKAERWPYDLITERGYAVITLSYLQVGPDHHGVFEKGIHSIFSESTLADRSDSEWGAIGMWAWTLSRVLDALEEGLVPEVNSQQVTVMGHSRLGKTALWAAAMDPRFAAAISNNSGCMGAALSRPVGETPEVLARLRPYWFAPRFSTEVMAGRPLPVDQHQLIACIAPRPVYVASASEDHNADPEGEFLSWREASQVWKLYGMQPSKTQFPQPGKVIDHVQAPLGYHLRDGEHDIETFDWQQWLNFTDLWIASR